MRPLEHEAVSALTTTGNTLPREHIHARAQREKCTVLVGEEALTTHFHRAERKTPTRVEQMPTLALRRVKRGDEAA